MKSSNLKLAVAIIVPLLAGFIGSFFTNPSIESGWYANLPKPALVPPGWVFPVVWTTLFVLMGIALYLVWRKPRRPLTYLAFFIFGLQLIFNVLWSILFFYFQNPSWALLEIIFLWILIMINIVIFGKIDQRAGWLLWPYLLWVSFATYLNYSIALGLH